MICSGIVDLRLVNDVPLNDVSALGNKELLCGICLFISICSMLVTNKMYCLFFFLKSDQIY